MNVRVSTENPADCLADVLVVNLFEGEHPSTGSLAAIDQKLGNVLERLVDLGELKGKLYQTTMVATAGVIAAPRLLVVGAGPRGQFSTTRARNVAGTATRSLQGKPIKTAALWLTSSIEPAAQAQAATEGALLGIFDPGEYKTHREDDVQIETLALIEESGPRSRAAQHGVTRGTIIGEAANLARHLANAPGNILTPPKLAAEAARVASAVGLEIDVIDRARMGDLGLGAILAVAEGSEQPPLLVVMTYRGRGGEDIDLAIVGKGVTFDTGGISIKPASDMHLMKEDMAGAAATIGAMQAIAQLKPAVNVIGVTPLVENMPSGHAMRPGDIVTALNGKTIEILNTDAEGRLILADALGYAQRLGAHRLIDAATLTGAVVVALGHAASGLAATPDNWCSQVEQVANAVGEPAWRLPLYEEYRDQLRSDVADIANVGGRAAGTLTAATFLREFVDEGNAWAHLDIAGTAWTEKALPYLAKGPAGVPLRTFVALAESLARPA